MLSSGNGSSHLLSTGVVHAFTSVAIDNVRRYHVLAGSSAIHSSQSLRCTQSLLNEAFQSLLSAA